MPKPRTGALRPAGGGPAPRSETTVTYSNWAPNAELPDQTFKPAGH